MPTTAPLNAALVVGAILSALAAALHVAIIVKGAPWYRFFGAGEDMARAAEMGRRFPAIITAAIAVVLALWSAYALSAAGALPPLPLLKPAIGAITLVYLLRGLVLVPVLAMPRGPSTSFFVWSSIVCLVFAATHLAGLIQVWARLP